MPLPIEDEKKQTKEEQLRDIVRYLQNDTVFMIHEDSEQVCPKYAKASVDEYKASRALLIGQIPKSDLYLIYAVYLLGFATPEMVLQELPAVSTLFPDSEIIPLTTPEAVRNRLMECCKYGLLYAETFSRKETDVQHFTLFYCAHNGFYIMKYFLGVHIYANEFLPAHASVNKVMRAAASYIALCIFHAIPEKSFVSGEEADTTFKDKKLYPKFMATVRGKCNGRSIVYVVEPIYFSFEKNYDNTEMRIKEYRKRLKLIEAWGRKMYTELKTDVQVVVVCENIDGIDKASTLIHGTIPNYEDHCIYTSELLMHEYNAHSHGESAFVKISIAGDKKNIMPYNILERV